MGFSNVALRWQLQRVLEDQVASNIPAVDHASLNSPHAEAWPFLSKRGVEAKWSLDDHERLIDDGWDTREAKAVADTVFDLQSGSQGGSIEDRSDCRRSWKSGRAGGRS